MNTLDKKLNEALLEEDVKIKSENIINLMNNSINKLVTVFIKKYRDKLKLNEYGDLLQEARLTIYKVLLGNYNENINCSISTYLLGAVKRRLKRVILNEFMNKNLAQTVAISLGLFNESFRYNKSNLKYIRIIQREVEPDLFELLMQEDTIDHITSKLEREIDKSIFIDLMSGDKIKEISKNNDMPQATIYNIIRFKIKPVVMQVLSSKSE